ncbi:DUF6079 family protein [Nannocystis bainbridge]|uniref:DUF6079 family protein n=1 Tax=Nannocystis bainbridge TaxID=2995303 RepID=A0ABT5E7R2_9BACT|nr:DUF6079 family protein [Nannocystis bainbridge]MDC0721695.1 DUF6079 family protein [Nannocystis bainbridge]
MTTIRDAYDLPSPEDIRAMGFVIKLREAAPDSDEVKKLVDDYVITPAVEKELPRILTDMKQVFDRGEEYGRFIHGSFGSGKSHFMTMLSLLIEGAAPAWDKFRPLLAGQRAHEEWLPRANLLVVRIHMLSVRGRTTSLDRAVYEGFNQALKRRGMAPFNFLNVDTIFEEVRREAQEYGDIVWKRLETASIIGGREDFEALAAGSPAGRERFALAWIKHKGRDPASAGIDPRWSDGLRRMTEHARAQGFGGVVLMLDEFLLWLAEKSGQEFVQEINNLNVIVDHNTGQRPAPMFVFVARQRKLSEFFPDLVDESKIHEHLDHHAKRFEVTELRDVELRHIVKGRVLRPRDPAAIARAVGSLVERHQKALPLLLAGGDIEYLKDVYPFHPALIEMLVDVSSLMQRERSALRLLYELLVLHYPDLKLGEFLPVGSAFAAIFPESGVEASKKAELMQDIHHQYYLRLAPAIQALARENPELNEERQRALDQFVKTVLLAEVSPRLKQGGLTIERLVQFNSADVVGDTPRGLVLIAETDLLALSKSLPDLQIAGQGKSALVRYVLGRVSLTDVLTRARSKVDSPQQRFKILWAALKKALGVDKLKGFEEGSTEGDWDLQWRKTPRRGRLKLGNVREMSYEDFDPPPGTFKILVDYPWDDPGHSVDEDRMRATNVRKKQGLLHTVCWLPRHMSTSELAVLTELAAVRFLLSEVGQAELLETYGPQDRKKIIEQAEIRANNLAGQIDALLVEVYIRHGEFFALISDIDGSRPYETLHENLKRIATLLMDRRYTQHPVFDMEPKKAELDGLLEWMIAAGETNVSVPYDESKGKILEKIGKPLELVNLGQTKASLRLDSRYIKDVLQRADHDSVSWAPVAEYLRDTYGFQPPVIDLFLSFLCQRDHRALEELTGDPIDVKIGMPPTTRVRLQRGKLVGAAEWHRLRDLGDHLFAVKRPPAHRSLQAQDRFALALKQQGQARRTVLQALHQRLINLGIESGARLEDLAAANTRLAPLAQATTDSHKVLSELLAQWPDDPSDRLRAVVQQCEALRDALVEINEHARDALKAGANHPALGVEVSDHLAALDARIAAAEAEQPITKTWILGWNQRAQELVHRLIAQPPITPKPPPPPPPQPEPTKAKILLKQRLNPGDPDAVSSFLAQVRRALANQSEASIQIVLAREEDAE